MFCRLPTNQLINHMTKIYRFTDLQIYRFTLSLLLLTAFAIGAKAQDYGIEVKGTPVTARNASSIWTGTSDGEQGKITFDPATRVLTLDNVVMNCSGTTESISIHEGTPEVTILLKGANVLRHQLGRLSLEGRKITITGKGGSLQSTAKGVACYIDYGCQLTIKGGCTVDVAGDYGIAGDGDEGGTSLTIDGEEGTVFKAKGIGMPSMSDLGEIHLKNCVIVEPYGATIKGGDVVVDGNATSELIIIKKVSVNYDVKVNGVAVTPENAADVLGNQTVVFKEESSTLTLSNSNISAKGVPAIEATTPIYIELVGENRVSSDSDKALLLAGKESTIHGSGSLDVSAPAGTAIAVEGSLKIKGVNCTATALRALQGSKKTAKLLIEDSHLVLDGSEGALYDFADISLVRAAVVSPDGAVAQDGAIMLDGSICKGKVVIDRPVDIPLFIAGKQVTSTNCHDILGDRTVSYDPDKKILKLNGFKFITEEMTQGVNVMQAHGDITIELHGDNEITTNYMGLYFASDGKIIGDGTLKITSKSQALVLNGTSLTIQRGPRLTISGEDSGIFGYLAYGGTIIFDAASVIVEKGGIVNLSDIVFEKCGISTPEGSEIIVSHNAQYGKEYKSIGLNGKIYKDRIVIDVTVGVEDALAPSSCQIRVAESTLYVRSDASQTLTLLDLEGRVHYATETRAGEECRVEGLSSGSYLLRLGSQTYKVVIP